MKRTLLSLTVVVLVIGTTLPVYAAEQNGFDLTETLVPADDIHAGGPARDGIPAIDDPRFVAAKDARFLQANDRVLGVTLNGISKAYPVKILNWHEIVNDRFGDDAVVVSYCPLCGTGMAYRAKVNGRVLDFGVSGLLYNSDMLLYDRSTESLWSQLQRQAISGPLKGETLQTLPLEHTRWSDWNERYPDTAVLSPDTGHQRDYGRNPYAGYGISQSLYFPVNYRDKRYHPKEPVLGIELAGQFKAYPFKELKAYGETVRDTLAGKRIVIRYDAGNAAATAHDTAGNLLPTVTAYWFAWYAFHPETAVYTAE